MNPIEALEYAMRNMTREDFFDKVYSYKEDLFLPYKLKDFVNGYLKEDTFEIFVKSPSLVIVRAINYENPTNEWKLLEKYLKSISYKGLVAFNLYLCNGTDESIFECEFNGNNFENSFSYSQEETLKEEEMKWINSLSLKQIENSVLSNHEKNLLIKNRG